MDNLIILAGLLATLRAYWTFNLFKTEKGEGKIHFWDFIFNKESFSYYFVIRPFYKKYKDELLKKKINIITYVIYLSFSLGMYFAISLARAT